MLEPRVQSYIERLTTAYPTVTSVWLFGSRADNTFRSDSDWDLLVFGSNEVLVSLKDNVEFHESDIDLLVVYDGDNFEKPWGERQKQGSLNG